MERLLPQRRRSGWKPFRLLFRKMEVHTLAYFAAVALSGLAALRPLVVYETIKQAAPISSWQFRVIAFLLGTSALLLLSVVQKEGAGHGHDEHLNH